VTETRVKTEVDLEFKLKLLTFGRFLKAAAARRQDTEEELDLEGKAFEGVLSNVYTGDVSAVEAIEKLINGVNEKVRDYTGELDVTCELPRMLKSQHNANKVKQTPALGSSLYKKHQWMMKTHGRQSPRFQSSLGKLHLVPMMMHTLPHPILPTPQLPTRASQKLTRQPPSQTASQQILIHRPPRHPQLVSQRTPATPLQKSNGTLSPLAIQAWKTPTRSYHVQQMKPTIEGQLLLPHQRVHSRGRTRHRLLLEKKDEDK
jgi:hypothetical protein